MREPLLKCTLHLESTKERNPQYKSNRRKKSRIDAEMKTNYYSVVSNFSSFKVNDS